MAAHLIGVKAGISGSPSDHVQDVIRGRAAAGELAGASFQRLNQRRIFILPDAGGAQIRVEVFPGRQHRRLAFLDQPAWAGAPARTALGAAYPNPSAGAVAVEYELAEAGPVEVAVFDVLGRRVRTLVTGRQAAGAHAAQWDGRSATGRAVASGLYLVRLRATGAAYTQTVTIVR